MEYSIHWEQARRERFELREIQNCHRKTGGDAQLADGLHQELVETEKEVRAQFEKWSSTEESVIRKKILSSMAEVAGPKFRVLFCQHEKQDCTK